ncbi:MAG: class F sortase [Nocardioides sp.]
MASFVLPSAPLDEPTTAVQGSAESPAPSQAPEASDSPPGSPETIAVRSLDLEAPLIAIEVDSDGVLTPPSDTSTVGWWAQSAEPGENRGQTVVTGHTVSNGLGVMNQLGEVDLGAIVSIRDGGRWFDYETAGVFKLTKTEVAENAERLFTQEGGEGRLVIVSCTDYVDGEYLSNIIVWADPVPSDGA